jgi:hypothetical protein
MANQKNSSNKQHDVTYESSLSQFFKQNVGNRMLVLTHSFPFIFIGHVKEVIDDCIALETETTHIEQLENRIWHIPIKNIELFYVEEEGSIPIPNLNAETD